MEELVIQLSTIEDVKEFVRIVSGFDGAVTIKSGRYVVDAKSVLGIFSVDLSKALIVSIDNPTPENKELLRRFMI